MRHLHTALWGVLPYLTLVVLVAGTAGATATTVSASPPGPVSCTRSRLLRIAGPLFHYGLLFVIAGHVAGLWSPSR